MTDVPYCVLQLSRFFYAACNTQTVWVQLARGLLLRNRPLRLIDFKDPETLSLNELKRTVLRTYRREKFWELGSMIYALHAFFLCMARMENIYLAKKFCSRYLLLQDRSGYIAVLDVTRNTCILSFDRPLLLTCVKREYREKSLYCIIGKLTGPVWVNVTIPF